MERLKQRWNIKSNIQLTLIFIVFALNGSLSLALIKPVLNFIGIAVETTNPVLFWIIRIMLMFVLYQILLLIVGSAFGQYKFFWAMEKKMLSRIGFKKFFEKKNDKKM